MIVKAFEIKINHVKENKIFLFYGNNQGHKNEIINNLFLNSFQGEIIKIHEDEIVEKTDILLENLMNLSLFENSKLLIVSRVTNKITDFISKFLDKDLKDVKILLNSENLEKSSKLRSFFEKQKKLICVPFYEDNENTLNLLANNLLKKIGVKFSKESLNLIISRAKGDRENLFIELNKIKNLSITKKNITIEDIKILTNLSENHTAFEIAENYLAKNYNKVSKILNENNFVNEDCVLILRTILNRSKRLLKLKELEQKYKNVDEVLTTYKPKIFWKEKDIVKKQIKEWSEEKIRKNIYKMSNLEILIKKNTLTSIILLKDFISGYQ